MRAQQVLMATAFLASFAAAQPAPLLDRISATPSADHEATVRGTAGAVAGSALVAVINTHTGHFRIVRASSDGAFEARLFAPGGSSVLIKSDPSGNRLREAFEGRSTRPDMLMLAGTVLDVPDSNGSNLSATMTGLLEFSTFPYWVMTARMSTSTLTRDQSLSVEGTITIFGKAAAGETPHVDVKLLLVAVSRPDGSGALDQNTFCSTSMTPTGLPIERTTLSYSRPLIAQAPPLTVSGATVQTTFQLSVPAVPAALADGYYRPMIMFTTTGFERSPAERPGVTLIDDAQRRREGRPLGLLPLIRIGAPAPPRLYWTLMADTFSQGARGVTAVEDRPRFGVSSRIALASDRFIIPRTDPRSGAAIRYNLEPYALTVAISNHGRPVNPPTIPFRYPSGRLTATIKRPNGETATIGPVPFRQARLYSLGIEPHGSIDANYFTDGYVPTTLDPRFEVTFVEDGLHEISLSGTIEDIWGTVWTGRGTYLIDVARPLEIDPAVLPGTPMQVGNSINPSVQLLPAVPADVEIRYRFAPGSRRALLREQTFRTKAGSNGYARLEPIALSEAGEYRIDIAASFHDLAGRRWSGTMTWGSVVAGSTSPIHLHGARGVDDQPSPRLTWYSRRGIGWSKDSGGHVQFAFLSGDVMWLADDDAITPAIRIDDRDRLIVPTLKQYCCHAGFSDDQVDRGEATFYVVGPEGIDPSMSSSDDAELWAYAYRFVERPRIRIREMISDGTVPGLYWRFDDRYALQSGTGELGDRRNDFKFQFAGAAFYGRALAQPTYSMYGSLFVLIANDDPDGTRVFPPFQGNGGGPPGGPLFRFKGRDVEMFFHPTSIRPGSIVDVGTAVSFAGQLAPMLPSKVEITVVSPGGSTRTISGQANPVGYFYDPASDFVIEEQGVWRVRVRVMHDGRTSAGQLTPPFPSGDVLGSREGEFYFYAIDRSAVLSVTAAGQAFTMVPPPDLTDIEIHYTVVMPGYILEEGTLDGLTYRYEPERFTADYPNLDPNVETIALSFLLSGKTAAGQRRFFGRQVLVQGDEVLMPDSPRTRRRTAGR